NNQLLQRLRRQRRHNLRSNQRRRPSLGRPRHRCRHEFLRVLHDLARHRLPNPQAGVVAYVPLHLHWRQFPILHQFSPPRYLPHTSNHRQFPLPCRLRSAQKMCSARRTKAKIRLSSKRYSAWTWQSYLWRRRAASEGR
ncbi:hypothetical protein LINGRAHAP2_LOCUS34918, partial [Linum grandiflorum]